MTRHRSDDIERLAHKRAVAKLGWYVHAAVYVAVNLLLLALSQYGFGSRPWSALPLWGWGLGLAIHAIVVFAAGTGTHFHERLFQQERDRLHRRNQNGS